MKIVAIRDQVVPVYSEIRNSTIDFSEMTVSIVAVVSDVVRNSSSVTGYGFNSAGRYAPGSILRERMGRRLLNATAGDLLRADGKTFDPFKAWQVMMSNEKGGGHGERSAAVGALDMALWDLVAKIEEKPLYSVLGEYFGVEEVDPSVYVYAAGGYYYPSGDAHSLQDEIRSYLDLGYRDVKIKIGGTTLSGDLKRIDGVLEVLERGEALAVDANCRFDLETALHYARALGSLGLKWYEEPGDPLDFELLAEVSRVSSTPLATGENLFSCEDSRNLIRYGGLIPSRDTLQMDPALSYGLVEYYRILNMLKQNGWSWRRCILHGGHQFAAHIAAGLGLGGTESYPSLFRPFGGFGDGFSVENGRLSLPDVPGIGIELSQELHKLFRALTDL